MKLQLLVLSGGPCSGKTTLARALGAAGHAIVPEAATDLIIADRGELWRRDPLEFQQAVFALQAERERDAIAAGSPTGLIVLDRAFGDNFGYLRFHDISPFDALEDVRVAIAERYRAVLILEPHPGYSSSSSRAETAEEARRVHLCLRECWRELHPRVLDVAWQPVEERLKLALRAVEDPS